MRPHNIVIKNIFLLSQPSLRYLLHKHCMVTITWTVTKCFECLAWCIESVTFIKWSRIRAINMELMLRILSQCLSNISLEIWGRRFMDMWNSEVCKLIHMHNVLEQMSQWLITVIQLYHIKQICKYHLGS